MKFNLLESIREPRDRITWFRLMATGDHDCGVSQLIVDYDDGKMGLGIQMSKECDIYIQGLLLNTTHQTEKGKCKNQKQTSESKRKKRNLTKVTDTAKTEVSFKRLMDGRNTEQRTKR